jgi:mannose-1-phosphate guanylyltransferase
MVSRLRRGLVLGAGLGNRLRPLTSKLPKPLIPVFGKPLITFALDHLRSVGVEDIAVNTHHLGTKFQATFPNGVYRGMPIHLVQEEDLLGTGGALKNIEAWIGDEPVIIYSGDLLSDLDILALVERHFSEGNEVTLALRRTGIAAGVAFDQDTQSVVDIGSVLGKSGSENLDFANVSIWNPALLTIIPPKEKISLAKVLLSWLSRGGKIGGIVLERDQWFNIGSRHDYFELHREIQKLKSFPDYLAPGWQTRIDASACAEPDLVLEGVSWIGPRSIIGPRVQLLDTIVWFDAIIKGDLSLSGAIVADSVVSGVSTPNQNFGFDR